MELDLQGRERVVHRMIMHQVLLQGLMLLYCDLIGIETIVCYIILRIDGIQLEHSGMWLLHTACTLQFEGNTIEY